MPIKTFIYIGNISLSSHAFNRLLIGIHRPVGCHPHIFRRSKRDNYEFVSVSMLFINALHWLV